MLLPGVEPGSFRFVNSQPLSWELGALDESERVTVTPEGPSFVGMDSGDFSICGIRHQLRSHGLIRTTTGSNEGEGILFLLYMSTTPVKFIPPLHSTPNLDCPALSE